MLVVASLSGLSQNQSGCNPLYQWVDYEYEVPSNVSFIKHMGVSNNELYILAVLNSNSKTNYNYEVFKLDTISSNWTTFVQFNGGYNVEGFKMFNGNLFVITDYYCNINGDTSLNHIVKYDGVQWAKSNILNELDVIYDINAIDVYNGELYVTGGFEKSSTGEFNGIAKYDGTNWSSLQSGLENGDGRCLSVYDNKLFIGGSFNRISNNQQNFACWDGINWISVPSIDSHVQDLHGTDTCIVAYSPNALNFGQVATKYFSYFDGNNWNSMGVNQNDLIGESKITSVNNKIYACSYFYPFLGFGNRLFVGTGFFENGSWHQTSYYTGYPDNNNLTSYNNQLIIADAEHSCGVDLEMLSTLCDTNNCGLIAGRQYVDSNSDCLAIGEVSLPGQIIKIGNNNVLCDSMGNYFRMVKPGTYNIDCNEPIWFSQNCQSGYVLNVNAGDILTGNNFALSPIPEKDLEVTITQGPSRVGMPSVIYVTAKNVGTVPLDGNVIINYADSLVYDSSNVTLSSSGNDLNWSVGTLNMYQSVQAELYFTVPPSISLMNQLIESVATGTILSVEGNLLNNSDTITQPITAAYDPNIKTVYPIGDTTHAFEGAILFGAEDEFTYTIYFQNTGNDTAFNVLLVDTLDVDFEVSSLEIIASSHDVNLEIYGTDILQFYFNDILLPDSTTNLLESQGFVKYKINTKSTIQAGDQVRNGASIFFDFNPPIYTNYTVNTFVLDLSTNNNNGLTQLDFDLFPNPTKGLVKIKINEQLVSNESYIQVKDVLGNKICEKQLKKSMVNHINDVGLVPGLYILLIVDKGKIIGTKKLIVE